MTQASDIVAELDRLYSASVERLQNALTDYLTSGKTPDPKARADGSFAYPEIRLIYRGDQDRPTPLRGSAQSGFPFSYCVISATLGAERPPWNSAPRNVSTTLLASSGPTTRAPSVPICASLLMRARPAE